MLVFNSMTNLTWENNEIMRYLFQEWFLHPNVFAIDFNPLPEVQNWYCRIDQLELFTFKSWNQKCCEFFISGLKGCCCNLGKYWYNSVYKERNVLGTKFRFLMILKRIQSNNHSILLFHLLVIFFWLFYETIENL